MSEPLQFGPYREMIGRLNHDIEPSQVRDLGNEVEYQFLFKPPFGGPVVMSAIWNDRLKRFYFDVQDSTNSTEYPLMTEDQFLEEMGDLIRKTDFMLQ